MRGERLGPYVIERELGAGGMGKVYAANVVDRAPGLDIGARVALKVVHPHLLDTPGFFKRFLREGQIGQSVRHENVVRTLDCDAIGSDHFLVMEYVEGQTLAELLDELERVPEELCRHVGREICKGLAAIHGAGAVHRDLKPENVIISLSAAKPDDDVAERPGSHLREGTAQPRYDHVVKVMDLGVAQLTEQSIRLSQTGVFIGSVEYAAPEQFRGGDVDHRCDLHALGLLLYELSCGQHPYRGDDFRVVMRQVLGDAPRRLGDVNPQLSAFFEEVVHTLLAKSRDDRFASADELLGVLEEGEASAWWKSHAKALQAETKRPIRRIRIPRETAVYGRDEELDRLRGLFLQAKSGDGQAVLIEGEAGIGKSRLVDELIGRLQADGEDLNFLFGGYPPGGAALAAGGFSSAYRDHFGEAGCADSLTQTPLLAPAFDAVLRGEPAPSGVVELTKDSLGTCFVHATRNLAAERVTVVLIDDLHFAPEEARALFTCVALAVPGHRVLLVGTMRPGVPEDWVANVSRLDHCSHMAVPRLGPKDLALLLKDSFRSEDLARSLGVQIGEKSDGNPFFAFEIIRGLREGQFITQKDDGTWSSTQVIDEIAIPSSVLDLVNARVADLTEDERNLLDVACCWGFDFDPVVVGEVLGMARIPLLRSLGQIERQHRLVRASGRTYVFDHHQVQEALYGSLSELLREEYHAALADALAARTKAADKDPETLDGALCVDLCEHYLKGARGEDALRYLEAAQTHLTTGYLHAQVVSLTERALAVPGLLTGTERAKALLRLVATLDTVGRRTRQEACAREAKQLADEAEDSDLRGCAETALGNVFWRTSRHTDAEVSFRRAIELALARGDRRAAARATGGLGGVLLSLGRFRDAQEHFERHLTLSREVADRWGEATATGNLGLVFRSLGPLREAKEHFERHLMMSRGIGDRAGEGRATGNLGLVFWSEGDLREAKEHIERHLAMSREIGDRAGESRAAGNLGIVLAASGHLEEAKEHCERSVVLHREIGDRAGEALSMGNLGVFFQSEGRLREAKEHHQRHLTMSREIGYRAGEVSALHNLGGVLREEGETAPAAARFLACLSLSEEIGHKRTLAVTRLDLGSLRAACSRSSGGDGEGGRESLAAARDLAAEVGLPGIETLARCELALLPGGDPQDALAAFTEHEERLSAEERRDARLLLWRSTGDPAHVQVAKRLLDESLAKVPAEYHESMLTNLRVNREIMAAWRAEFGDDEGDDGRRSESEATLDSGGDAVR